MKKWQKFTRQQIEEMVKESKSNKELAGKLGYSLNGGGSIGLVKEMIDELQLDTSHFLGQGINKNNFDYSRFRYGNNIKIANALPALVHKREHRCEKCKNVSWNNELIPLEIHHIDGDNLNNDMENLSLLCPNCHAQTDDYCKGNKHGKMKVTEEDFVDALKSSPNIRQALLKIGLTAKGANYTRARELIHKFNIEHLL